MGRTARGVRGIRLGEGHAMISLIIPQTAGMVLTVSENGYGKRTLVEDFPTKGRAGKGLIAMSTSNRNGKMVGAAQVFAGDELMLISNQGTVVRTRADEVSILGRNTQGVRVIRTKDGERLVGVQRIDEPAEETLQPVSDARADGVSGADTITDTSAERDIGSDMNADMAPDTDTDADPDTDPDKESNSSTDKPDDAAD
jgi:DNA gyrase subunit A